MGHHSHSPIEPSVTNREGFAQLTRSPESVVPHAAGATLSLEISEIKIYAKPSEMESSPARHRGHLKISMYGKRKGGGPNAVRLLKHARPITFRH